MNISNYLLVLLCVFIFNRVEANCGLGPGKYQSVFDSYFECAYEINIKCLESNEIEVETIYDSENDSDISISSFKEGRHTEYFLGGLSSTYDALLADNYIYIRFLKKKYLVFNEVIGSIAMFQSGDSIDVYRNYHAKQAVINEVYSDAFCRYQKQ
jgi:hypothetical protein